MATPLELILGDGQVGGSTQTRQPQTTQQATAAPQVQSTQQQAAPQTTAQPQASPAQQVAQQAAPIAAAQPQAAPRVATGQEIARAMEDKNPYQFRSDGRMTYTQMNDFLERRNREQDAAAKKRQRRDAIFAAIGDTVSALSNLYFTGRDAPNSFNPRNTLSAANQARWDRINQERENNQNTYAKRALDAMQRDDAAYTGRQRLEMQRAAAEQQQAANAVELQLAIDKAKNDGDLTRAKMLTEMYNAQIKAAEAEAKPGLLKSEEDRNRAAAQSSRASAASSYASAENSRASRRGKQMSLNVGGDVTYYDNEEDYERAVQREANRLGIPTHQWVSTKEQEADGRRTTGKTRSEAKAKPISQLAAEVERKSAKKKTIAMPNTQNKTSKKKQLY